MVKVHESKNASRLMRPLQRNRPAEPSEPVNRKLTVTVVGFNLPRTQRPDEKDDKSHRMMHKTRAAWRNVKD